jgi:hypothetical protein
MILVLGGIQDPWELIKGQKIFLLAMHEGGNYPVGAAM